MDRPCERDVEIPEPGLRTALDPRVVEKCLLANRKLVYNGMQKPFEFLIMMRDICGANAARAIRAPNQEKTSCTDVNC